MNLVDALKWQKKVHAIRTFYDQGRKQDPIPHLAYNATIKVKPKGRHQSQGGRSKVPTPIQKERKASMVWSQTFEVQAEIERIADLESL